MTRILGIDPGISGALAFCCEGDWILIDMPIVGDAKGRSEINGPGMVAWLRAHRAEHAFIEYAAARPGQGVTSMFRYGVAYGMTKMALAAVSIPFTVVTPQKWKAAVGIQAGASKEASRLRALQLFPDQGAHLARKKDHARADAMLLAHYGILLKGGIAAGRNR